MSRLIITLIVCLVLGSVFFWIKEEEQSTFAAYELQMTNYQETIPAWGEVSSRAYESVKTPRSRYERQITYLAPEGNLLNEGDLLVTFDDTELATKLIELNEQRAELELRLDERVRLAEIIEEEYAIRKSLAKNLIDSREVLLRVNEYSASNQRNVAEIMLKDANFDLEALEKLTEIIRLREKRSINHFRRHLERKDKEIEDHQDFLTEYTQRISKNGFIVYPPIWKHGIGMAKIEQGDAIGASREIGQIPDTDKLSIELKVEETWKQKLVLGTPIRFIPKTDVNQQIEARIVEVSPLASVDQNRPHRKVFSVVAELVNPADANLLKIGLTGEAQIVGQSFENVYLVPKEFAKSSPAGLYVSILSENGFEDTISLENATSLENFYVLQDRDYPQLKAQSYRAIYTREYGVE